MGESLARELYGKMSLGAKHDSGSTLDSNAFEGGDLQTEDGSLWDESDDELNKAFDLDWDWQRRHDQFHTAGYRDGIIAGKEAAAQEGFNVGFKQTVLLGYNWGLVRGVTSALALVSDELREKLLETQEKRNKFEGLYEDVSSLSTIDALKLFQDEILTKRNTTRIDDAETILDAEGLQERNANCSNVGIYVRELKSLFDGTPAVKVHFAVDKQ